MNELQSFAQSMVNEQLRARGLTDERVCQAMINVPRHRFVPHIRVDEAYADKALPTAEGQTISQPYMVALMTELLWINPGHKVLEIGTGSGYQTAILAELGATVVTVERVPGLLESAKRILSELELDSSIHFVEGDGTLGYADAAPYDRILVTAGARHLPEALKVQLADGGRIVVPVGGRYEQRLLVYTLNDGRWSKAKSVACRFVPLIGVQGW